MCRNETRLESDAQRVDQIHLKRKVAQGWKSEAPHAVCDTLLLQRHLLGLTTKRHMNEAEGAFHWRKSNEGLDVHFAML